MPLSYIEEQMRYNDQQTITIDNKEYEISKISTKLTNKSVNQNSLLIGNRGYVVVSNGYRIYNGKSGKPIIHSKFNEIRDAVKVAELINQIYKDYLIIWEDYPNADIVKWCRYTIPDGVVFERMIDKLNQKESIDGIVDVGKALSEARKEIKQDEYIKTN